MEERREVAPSRETSLELERKMKGWEKCLRRSLRMWLEAVAFHQDNSILKLNWF